MKKNLSQAENQKYWEEKALRFSGNQASWWDINMKRLEVQNIVPYLAKEDLVLDIGCSNGASTLEIYRRVKCQIHGIDYSKESINEAKKIDIWGLSFEYADITKYSTMIKYDKAFSIRCLINIMSKRDQRSALLNIYNLLKEEGLYIMAEAFHNGLKNLNKARKLFKLQPLEEPDYNNYLKEKEFENFISRFFEIIEIKKYASLYYIGTRLFQYLTLDCDPTKADSDLHKFFAKYYYETKNSGDFSPQKIYVLKKKK